MYRLVRNAQTRRAIAAEIDAGLAACTDTLQVRSFLSLYTADALRRYMAAKVYFAKSHKADMINTIVLEEKMRRGW